MKRRILFIVLLFLFLSRPISKPQASCIIGGGKSVSATVSFQSFGDEGSNLTVNGRSFFRNKPQCTSPQQSRSYTISCDEETETLAADSLFAPLCGSSEERGKTNSSCWQCGGTVKCDGLDGAAGATDPFISQIHNPVSLGDTNMDQVWRIPNGAIPNTIIPNSNPPRYGFLYNGNYYDKPSGDIIACGSNNLACGSSEECTNIQHPDVNNRGRSGQKQCTAYSYTKLSLIPGSSSGASDTVKIGGDKACINIGDYSSHFNELSRAAETFPNGWIYILALPEWMDSISKFIGEHPNNNFMIRLHSPVAELSSEYANRWVANLKTYAGNITNKVYLMPVNEPNNADPNRHVEVDTARVFISALSQGLDNAGLLNTKYIVTSPMIDPTAAGVTGYLDNFCADEFCKQFAAVAVAPYDFTGDMADIKAYFPGVPMIVAETGIKRNGQVVYGNDSETADFLHSVKDSWGKSAIAACIFSYDPDRNTNQEWIYSATNTLTALRGLGQSIKPIAAPQVIKPKTERSTISYESCTTLGAPETVSVVALPNLIDIGSIGRNEKTKKSFFAGFTNLFGNFFTRQINNPGVLGFEKNKAAEPSIFARFGAQLDKAMPYLTPLAINVQPIAQEYTHSVTSTLCFDADENKQAFPIKRIIQLPAEGLNKVWQNGRMMAGFIAPNVSIERSEYEHLGERYPNVLANIDANPGCEDKTPGRNIRRLDVSTTNPEEYNIPFEKLPKYFAGTVARLLGLSALPTIGQSCDDGKCPTDVNPAMNAHLKLKTPYIGLINRNLANDATNKPVGALATFVPGSFSFPNEHGKVTDLTIAQSVGSNSEGIRSQSLTYAYAKVQQNYIDFTNCAIRPGALQKDLDYSCNFSENDATPDRPLAQWFTTSSSLPSNFTAATIYSTDIQSAIADATKDRIPACVLEAVKYIETGTQSAFSSQCSVNSCSAAGPFQITTGWAPDASSADGYDPHCKKCGSSWTDGSRTCPDGWPGDWPVSQSDPSPCDMRTAAQRAVQMLIDKTGGQLNATTTPQGQRDTIILAGNRYYGSAETIPRLGGCSYGEYVYKHCDGSYSCGSSNVGL